MASNISIRVAKPGDLQTLVRIAMADNDESPIWNWVFPNRHAMPDSLRDDRQMWEHWIDGILWDPKAVVLVAETTQSPKVILSFSVWWWARLSNRKMFDGHPGWRQRVRMSEAKLKWFNVPQPPGFPNPPPWASYHALTTMEHATTFLSPNNRPVHSHEERDATKEIRNRLAHIVSELDSSSDKLTQDHWDSSSQTAQVWQGTHLYCDPDPAIPLSLLKSSVAALVRQGTLFADTWGDHTMVTLLSGTKRGYELAKEALGEQRFKKDLGWQLKRCYFSGGKSARAYLEIWRRRPGAVPTFPSFETEGEESAATGRGAGSGQFKEEVGETEHDGGGSSRRTGAGTPSSSKEGEGRKKSEFWSKFKRRGKGGKE
ncbi:hypothetical protein QBC35DRAFT_465341 [Podospora australis]|uniref:Uncharacterized protein n=1 Tax=Podospora australis TaxID=1536484 RepID=A0AAN7AFW9_9PEZI|nr:hypothetical protein QBC35DRAFT_465341 [Podospora australis]